MQREREEAEVARIADEKRQAEEAAETAWHAEENADAYSIA